MRAAERAHVMSGPDPWAGFDFDARRQREPEVVRPKGSRYLRARYRAGVEQQATDLGLELTTDITFNPNDIEYSAWASPTDADRDQT
jgi:hypothetical protein